MPPKTARTRAVDRTAETPDPSAVWYRLGRFILLATMVLVPLTVTQPGKVFYNSLDTPRRMVLLLGAGLLAAVILKCWSVRRRISLRWTLLDAAVLVYLAGVTISGFGGAYPRITFLGPLWVQDSILLLYLCAALFFGVKEFLRTREDLELGAFTIVMVGALVAVIGLFDYAVLPHLADGKDWALNVNFFGSRLVGTLGNPMFTATYLATLIPLGIGLASATQHVRRAWLCWASVGLMLVALLLTTQRAAWIGVTLSMPLVLTLAYRRLRTVNIPASRAILLGVPITFVMLVGLALLFSPTLRKRITSFGDLQNDATVVTRKVYMAGSWGIFKARPIQGAGYGNLKAIFPSYRPSSMVIESGMPLNRGFCTAMPHNLLLQTAADSGLLGLIPFLGVLVCLYVVSAAALRGETWQQWMAIGTLGGLTSYVLSVMLAFDNSATMAHFWLLLGLLGGLVAQERALPSRYGDLGGTLTYTLAKMVSVASLVIALATGLAFVTQTYVGYASQQAIDDVMKATELLKQNTNQAESPQAKEGFALYDRAIVNMGGLAGLNIDLNRYTIDDMLVLHVIDQALYDNLYMATNGRMQFIIQNDLKEDQIKEDQKIRLFNKVIRIASDRTFQLYDRAPVISRYVVLDAVAHNDFERAQWRASALTKYEPNSAEAYLLQGQVSLGRAVYHLEHGSIDQVRSELAPARHSLERALKLDPTFPDAYASMGKIMFISGKVTPNRANEFYQQSLTNYDKVANFNADLTPTDRLAFAAALLEVGQADRAVTEAARLIEFTGPEGKPPLELVQFESELQRFYQERKQPVKGQEMMRKFYQAITALLPPQQSTAPAPSGTSGAQPWAPGQP